MLANKVVDELTDRVQYLQRREIIKSSLQKNGFVALCAKMSDAILLANEFAPEHLEILTKNPSKISGLMRTPGLVLLGKNTPSAASDYLLGTNHILPTDGFGKSRGALSVLDYVKIQTTVESSRQALQKIKKPLKAITESENLPNHYNAVKNRL
jgi:histidinol dehydrogenase